MSASGMASLPDLSESRAHHDLTKCPLFARPVLALPADRRPVVISGPSGVGKGTLYKLLFERHPGVFALSVSHTTRAPRPGETSGVEYHFVDMPEFEAIIAADGFVEHAMFSGNRYGTSKMTIEEQSAKGKVVVLDIEMEVSTSFPPPSPPPHPIAPFPPARGIRRTCKVIESRREKRRGIGCQS